MGERKGKGNVRKFRMTTKGVERRIDDKRKEEDQRRMRKFEKLKRE